MMDYSSLFSDDTHSFFRSPVREIFKRVDLSKIYSFAGGYPSDETFPLAAFKDVMSKVITEYGGKAFQYGPTQGVPELRQVIAGRYGVPVEQVQITSSSQQGIDVCTRVLVNPGDVVLTSNPTYLGGVAVVPLIPRRCGGCGSVRRSGRICFPMAIGHRGMPPRPQKDKIPVHHT